MKTNEHYPKHISYKNRRQRPSVLEQEFPLPSLDAGEVYYPENKLLSGLFTTASEKQMFGAAQFISFLNDTSEVEHHLVIPAITGLRRFRITPPREQLQELFKIATDEAFHAEQALAFLGSLEDNFGLPEFSGKKSPLFINRLTAQIRIQTNASDEQLLRIVNGIVTETRISLELGQFAANHDLSDSVREICRTHTIDEVLHASQFKALGLWLWEEADEKFKAKLSNIYMNSAIARNMPDIDAIIISFSKATGRSLEDSARVILSIYDEHILIDHMLLSAEPTFEYLRHQGVENFVSIDDAINTERIRLSEEFQYRRRSLNLKARA